MRLIDADRLIKLLKEQKVKETGAYTKGINSGLNVAKCIINDNTVQSPIAHDVEKVVEQLEEKAELAYRRYMDCPPLIARAFQDIERNTKNGKCA